MNSQIPITVRNHQEGLLKIEIPEIVIQWAQGKAWKAAFFFSSARDSDTCSLEHLPPGNS